MEIPHEFLAVERKLPHLFQEVIQHHLAERCSDHAHIHTHARNHSMKETYTESNRSQQSKEAQREGCRGFDALIPKAYTSWNEPSAGPACPSA